MSVIGNCKLNCKVIPQKYRVCYCSQLVSLPFKSTQLYIKGFLLSQYKVVHEKILCTICRFAKGTNWKENFDNGVPKPCIRTDINILLTESVSNENQCGWMITQRKNLNAFYTDYKPQLQAARLVYSQLDFELLSHKSYQNDSYCQ